MVKTLPKTILLVDDDTLLLRMYQTKLSTEGFRVLTAPNGKAGVEMAKKDEPDLVLLDLMMPEMDGIETLKALKQNPGTKNIPVIILTNVNDSTQDVARAKEMGALDYFVKSEIDLKTLCEKVKISLRDISRK